MQVRRLDHGAKAYGVGGIELGVEIQRPAAIASPLLKREAIVIHSPYQGEPIHHRPTADVGGMAVNAKACLTAGARHLFYRLALGPGEGGGIAFDILARLAAEQLIDRHAQCLALEIP